MATHREFMCVWCGKRNRGRRAGNFDYSSNVLERGWLTAWLVDGPTFFVCDECTKGIQDATGKTFPKDHPEEKES